MRVVESPQAVAFLAEDRAQVLEGHRVSGIGGKSLHGELLGLLQVTRLQAGDPQGHAGVEVLRSDLQAAEEQLCTLVKLLDRVFCIYCDLPALSGNRKMKDLYKLTFIRKLR
jgi:hypothetical protein